MVLLPDIFKERMKKLLDEQYTEFESEIVSKPASKALFTDGYALDCQKFSATPIPFYNNAYYFDYDGIGNEPIHHAGSIYIQDPSAMASIAAISERKFKNVLDMCASPGGKSLGASLLMEEGGVIICNEYVPARCKTLVGNIERFGIKNAVVTCLDMTEKNELSELYENYFDLIICDAPCSGEGMFRKYPKEALGEWSLENIRLCASRQKEILDNAAYLVKGGGILLYSTCTFSLEENEMQADEFLTRHPEFELIPVSKAVQDATVGGYVFEGCKHESVSLTRRFYPHISRGEGQFIAVFRKASDSISPVKNDKYKSPISKPSEAEMKVLSEFIGKTVKSFDYSHVFKYNENLIYVDFDAKVPSKKVFSCGVKLGEVIKNRFEPHHQFFKCFGKDFKHIINLHDGDERISKYIHGEVIEADIENGWCVILYEGSVLGGGKAVDGVVKNHYPKGLRTV